MLRVLIVFALAAAALPGAIFPERVGPYTRSSVKAVSVPDQALYQEFGLEEAEEASYATPKSAMPEKRLTVTAWRLKDPTGALALFDTLRPAGGAPFMHGNYIFKIAGATLAPKELDDLYTQLPKLDQSPLPVLMSYLPPGGLIPGSERYVLGPVSLEHSEPRISPSLAAFHMGAEAQLGKYKTPKGILTLAIFNYPTPSIARDRLAEFEKLPGAMSKRAGPMVAVIVSPADPDAAERLLAQVRYETNLTLNEKVPGNVVKDTANLLISIFVMSGILIGMSIVAGIAFGGFRILRQKMGWQKEDPGAMIRLGLGDK